jgi:S-adenosylmethionine:tRNA ribosyltransferase-isomerase
MRTDLFDFELPEDRIAQQPLAVRDQARMMVLHRENGQLDHRRVCDLPDYLRAPDLLVVNNTRVIPARLVGAKEGTGGQVELLLLEETALHEWDALMRCTRRPAIGTRIFFAGGRLRAVVLAYGEQGRVRVRLECEGTSLMEVLDEVGLPPLPPYIGRKEASAEQRTVDRNRYQTVYAEEPGAVAAPTAGLHFTPDLFARLEAVGVCRAALTLHVGLGTFRPVSVDELEAHPMESERYRVTPETARLCQETKAAGGRIVAVGSTSVRTLETVACEHGQLTAAEGRSSIYIYPPYPFQAVDAIITNFHLPKSTLLMMMSAFAGREQMLAAYRVAIEKKYRFYSYGDCMLIL